MFHLAIISSSVRVGRQSLKAVPSPAIFPVPTVQNSFDEHGSPTDRAVTDKRAAAFVRELLWFAEAFGKMK